LKNTSGGKSGNRRMASSISFMWVDGICVIIGSVVAHRKQQMQQTRRPIYCNPFAEIRGIRASLSLVNGVPIHVGIMLSSF
jgi:hypothetical protein